MSKPLLPNDTEGQNLSNTESQKDSLHDLSKNDVLKKLNMRRKIEDLLEEKKLRDQIDDFFDF